MMGQKYAEFVNTKKDGLSNIELRMSLANCYDFRTFNVTFNSINGMGAFYIMTSTKCCSKCGQPLPQLPEKTLKKFDRMCKIWIALLMREKS